MRLGVRAAEGLMHGQSGFERWLARALCVRTCWLLAIYERLSATCMLSAMPRLNCSVTGARARHHLHRLGLFEGLGTHLGMGKGKLLLLRRRGKVSHFLGLAVCLRTGHAAGAERCCAAHLRSPRYHLTTLGTRSSAVLVAEPGRYVALGWRGVNGRLPSCVVAHDAHVNQALLRVKAVVGMNSVSDMGNSG